MSRAIAIVIGVGSGPLISNEGLETLDYAEPGASDILKRAVAVGYTPGPNLIGPNATLANVEAALRAAVKADPPWDTVLLVFSGHGLSEDSGGLCESGSEDEHWCLHDKLLVDDHLLQFTQQLAPATRLYIVADCCYAAEGSGIKGLVARLLRRAGRFLTEAGKRQSSWAAAVKAQRDMLFDCSEPSAQWILFGASSSSPAEAKAFMNAFLAAWDQPPPQPTFREFEIRIRANYGKPAVRCKDASLLDLRAFVP
jgi:hypothetical protein